jgi:hypothetical protein
MVRDYEPADLDEIKEIHKEQGLDYSLPDLNSPLCIVKKVRVEGGRVVGMMFLRLTAEAFLVVSGSPVAKGRAIEELQPEVLSEAFAKGLDEISCVVPPDLVDSFQPVLERFDWSRDRDGWVLYTRTTE